MQLGRFLSYLAERQTRQAKKHHWKQNYMFPVCWLLPWRRKNTSRLLPSKCSPLHILFILCGCSWGCAFMFPQLNAQLRSSLQSKDRTWTDAPYLVVNKWSLQDRISHLSPRWYSQRRHKVRFYFCLVNTCPQISQTPEALKMSSNNIWYTPERTVWHFCWTCFFTHRRNNTDASHASELNMKLI